VGGGEAWSNGALQTSEIKHARGVFLLNELRNGPGSATEIKMLSLTAEPIAARAQREGDAGGRSSERLIGGRNRGHAGRMASRARRRLPNPSPI